MVVPRPPQVNAGGEAGIRTLGGVAPTTIFETVPFNRSGTSPASDIIDQRIVYSQPREGAGGREEETRDDFMTRFMGTS